MAETKQILLVEDDKVDQMAFKRMVKQERLPYDYTIAESCAAARKILTSDKKFDAIILDFNLGDGNSLELADLFNAIEAPIIFATGTGNEAVAVQALKSGAYDYLIKDLDRNYLKVLAATVENAIQRKQADEYVRILSHAVMSTSDSIYITNMAGKIIYVNKAFCQTYGYEEEEILEANCGTLYVQTDNQQDINDLSIPITGGEFYHKRKDSSEFPVSLSRSLIKDDFNNKRNMVVTVVRDITERKRFEQELRQLNADKDKFFSIVSHDLRSPFVHLIGYSDLLLAQINSLSQDEVRIFVDTINRSAKHLLNLLENLLQWSIVQRGKKEHQPVNINLGELVANVIELMKGNASKKNIKLSHTVDGSIVIFADQMMISSVIQNLTSNALKFTKNDGQVTITAKQKDKFVEVSVSDTGIGMKQEVIDSVFRIDTHHTTLGTADEKGTGLGLILCQEFVERNGGKLWIESIFGQGTTFTFTVPV